MTAAVPPTAGQLVTSERGDCGGPLAFHCANLMSHIAFRQSWACVKITLPNKLVCIIAVTTALGHLIKLVLCCLVAI
jgi:hypothetical protein